MITLQNGYCIESDGTQYILKSTVTREKKETGEKYESFEIRGYYGKLDQALNGYVDKAMLDFTKCETVPLYQVLDKLKEIKEEIKAYR